MGSLRVAPVRREREATLTDGPPPSWLSPEHQPGLVSVVIPTYNRARFVSAALESVRLQTYRPLEVIVVDDGSTDDTETVVRTWQREWAAPDFDVTYVKKRNEGAPIARNEAIRRSRGEGVALLDSDDEWSPRKIELQMQRMACSSASVGLIYTGAVLTARNGGERVLHATHRGRVLRRHLYRNVVVAASGALIRRRALCDVGGFDPALPAAQDYELWIRILSKYAADFIDEPLVRVNVHGDENRISNNPSKMLYALDHVFAKHRELIRAQGVSSEYVRRTAWHCQHVMNDRPLARRRYLDALAVDPLNGRAQLGLLSTFVPQSVLSRMRRAQ